MAKDRGIDDLLQEVGLAIGRTLAEGAQQALAGFRGGARFAPPTKRGPGRPRKSSAAVVLSTNRGPGRPRRSAAEAACQVPGCERRSVAKKLCPTHYRKAGRLGYRGTLSATQLANLAADGRATRWEQVKGKK